MQSPYHPYGDIYELLDAAGVPVADMDRYATPVLLRMAADRRGGSEPRRSSNPRTEKEPMVTRTTRIPHSLDVKLEKMAKKAGVSASRAVAALIQAWVEGS